MKCPFVDVLIFNEGFFFFEEGHLRGKRSFSSFNRVYLSLRCCFSWWLAYAWI